MEYTKMGISDMRMTKEEGLAEFRQEIEQGNAKMKEKFPEYMQALSEVEKSEFKVPRTEGHDNDVLVMTYRA